MAAFRCAVASPHAGATEAAAAAVRRGGNAIDAALAAAFALTVAYPHNTSIGGDLFALVRQPDGTVRAVNASGPAAAAVDVADVRARHGGRMPDRGPDTVTVPGAVAGLAALHHQGAALAWPELIEPARAMAEAGVEVSKSVARAVVKVLTGGMADPGLTALLAPRGAPLEKGDTLVQPRLAATLQRLAAAGPDDFYRGALAQQLATGLQAAGCALALEDLARFEAVVEEPLVRRVLGVDVATTRPNSQGFVLLAVLQALELLSATDPLGAGAGELATLFAEGSRQRDLHLADPVAMEVGVDELLEPERWRRVLEQASPPPPGGPADPAGPELEGWRGRPGGDTVAVVAADSEGRAVSLIQSLFQSFGAGILEPATGVIVHDRGALFSLSPSSPNVLAPGKRPAHTLMPVLVSTGGSLRLVAGTMGGRAQPQIHAQLLLRVLSGTRPADALGQARLVVDRGNDRPVATVEPGLPAAARAGIARRMEVVDLDGLDESAGQAHLIAVDGAALEPASDPRSDGAAAIVSRP